MGNYHPHGDQAIYPPSSTGRQPGDARDAQLMARTLWRRGRRSSGVHALHRGPPAHLGAALMTDMDKGTVDFIPNYDEAASRFSPQPFRTF